MTTVIAPPAHRLFRIAAEEDVGVLRRAVVAQDAGASVLKPGDAQLVATELATNILRHAGSGQVLTRQLDEGGVELIAVDHGPGLSDSARDLLRDGFAAQPRLAGGGLGVGLAAVRRRADVFDYYSDRDGTVILAQLGVGQRTPAAWRLGGVNVPLAGQGPSGDAFAVAVGPGGLTVLMVDGIGHGPEAAEAARAAVWEFERTGTAGAFDDPARPAEGVMAELVTETNRALRGTRGAVIGLCRIDPGAGKAVFAGVGNIVGRIEGPSGSARFLSHAGTLGTAIQTPRFRAEVHPWRSSATLLMASDGIDTRWDLAERPALLRRHPAVIAAVLHRDHARARDDAAVLVVSQAGASAPGRQQ